MSYLLRKRVWNLIDMICYASVNCKHTYIQLSYLLFSILSIYLLQVMHLIQVFWVFFQTNNYFKSKQRKQHKKIILKEKNCRKYLSF